METKHGGKKKFGRPLVALILQGHISNATIMACGAKKATCKPAQKHCV